MRWLRFVAVPLTVLSLVGIGPLGDPAAAASPAVGVYTGSADTPGTNDFGSWLGAPVPYASDFVDFRYTWNDVSGPNWLLDAWSPWVKAVPGRRLVIAVPLLINSASGQLQSGASGAFDSHFRTLAQNMITRSLGSSVVRLGWEPNNPSFPWFAGKDPAAYKAFYARVVTAMRSVPGAAFVFDWNPLAGIVGGSSLTTFDSFYPGDAYVDVIGLDQYDIKWQDSTSTPAQRWSWTLSRALGLNDHAAFATAHNKPLSFPEWGLYRTGDTQGGGGDNPYFVDRMADWFSGHTTLYQSYFDEDWGGGAMASFPNGQARYKARFGATSPTTTTVAPTPATTTTIKPATTTTTVKPATTTTTTPRRKRRR